MPHNEWPAGNYAIGSYLQATVAEQYLTRLATKANDQILDIGCGDGAFSAKITERVPGTLLGIDSSATMLALAKQKMLDHPNFSVQQDDVLTMNFNQQFDWIISFWCLHWCTELECACANIYRALKQHGKLLAILPTGDDSFMASFNAVKKSGKFPCLQTFKPPVDYQKIASLPDIIAHMPFKNSTVKVIPHTIRLPSLDTYRKFVNGFPFFNGQVPDEEIANLNEAIVRAYALECKERYQGEYVLNVSIYLVAAEK